MGGAPRQPVIEQNALAEVLERETESVGVAAEMRGDDPPLRFGQIEKSLTAGLHGVDERGRMIGLLERKHEQRRRRIQAASQLSVGALDRVVHLRRSLPQRLIVEIVPEVDTCLSPVSHRLFLNVKTRG